MTVTLVCEDVVRWADTYDGEPFHAMLTDAPYELAFMSQDWDRSGIAFQPRTWQALARHLLPGAFVMAFASSRGYHRLACALEDAGLVLHPVIGWVRGEGWPKATRIDAAVDKAAGVEQEVTGYADRKNGATGFVGGNTIPSVTAPATPLAQTWAGHRYGRQMLKPALEFIAVAQKPYAGSPVDSITRTGAGALWIEGGRLEGSDDTTTRQNTRSCSYSTTGEIGVTQPKQEPYITGSQHGRWPANLALGHLPACRAQGPQEVRTGSHAHPGGGTGGMWSTVSNRPVSHGYASPDGAETVQTYHCAEGCPIAMLDAQAGERSSGGHSGRRNGLGYESTAVGGQGDACAASNGPASRFFFTADWTLDIEERLAQVFPLHYCPKASTQERSAGCASRNRHPTVKPLTLCRWLATLLLPPAAYAPRRLLVPFCGSSSEMIGGVLAGWDVVLGIDRMADYLTVAAQRVAYWTGQRAQRQGIPAAGRTAASPGQQLHLW